MYWLLLLTAFQPSQGMRELPETESHWIR